jgi:arylsulfatase A-like enzyme
MRLAVLMAVAILSLAGPAPADDQRPNFVIIMADDMGFSDPGCYGGEIRTPSIDALAAGGLRFTQFYNAARCCPTRASLLTGLYPHQAGMAENGQNLSRRTATLAEVLRAAGYQTGMAGKWHLSRTAARESEREQLDWLSHRAHFGDFAPRWSYPSNRGFDQHWGVIWGVVNFFDPFSLVHNEEPIRDVPEGFYMTDFITDKSVEMIEDFSRVDRPFFLYVAHTAPHWPLHAPAEEIAAYRGAYDGGWEALRETRYRRQLAAGLFEAGTTPLPANSSGRAWRDVERKAWEAAHMEVHAAMVTRLDRGVGRVLTKLEETGEVENTLVLFLSDNGASPERGYPPGFDRPGSLRDGTPIRYEYERPGPADTWGYLGAAWASALNTPFRYWKKESFEGGACTPAIVYWPRGLAAGGGSVTTAVAHVMDVLPTLAELASAEPLSELEGRTLRRPEGRSLVPLLRGEPYAGHEVLYWEHEGGRAVREGDWKLAALPDGEWELFDLSTDRSESRDVSATHPDEVAHLAALWSGWWERMQQASD